MATEKDIKRFMQDHRIPVPKDDRFMDELVRQIDLLPVPASLSGRDEEKLNESLRIVGLIRATFRRRYRRQALAVLIADIVICSVICLIGYLVLIPEVTATPALQFISTWRYLFIGIINVGLLFVLCRDVALGQF
ncbi:MAG: hypothetical protein J6B97_03965 [Bacteroidales bacterium]|nr:hypothetical protein [Bacteroidales bacterium]MBO5472144.1 hypothetical protein [Bacteroidales bacterium]